MCSSRSPKSAAFRRAGGPGRRRRASGAAAGEIAVLGGGDALGRQAAVLPALDHPHQRRRPPALGVDLLGLHHLLQQAELVVGVEDGEAAVSPTSSACRRSMRAHSAWKVPSHSPSAGRPRMARHALAHLARRLVGEGDGEHLAGGGAAGQQDMGEAGGQHAGLAGAGAGQHQQRAVQRFHRLALFRVQAVR